MLQQACSPLAVSCHAGVAAQEDPDTSCCMASARPSTTPAVKKNHQPDQSTTPRYDIDTQHMAQKTPSQLTAAPVIITCLSASLGGAMACTTNQGSSLEQHEKAQPAHGTKQWVHT